jgi:type IX secretion system PorP/SprF family membrane protein
MRSRLNIIVLFLLSVALYGQQQTLYTNYLMHQYLYNPAYAGVVKGTQFNAGYRNQWLGFEGAPKTFIGSGYGNFKKKPNMTVGGLVSSERIGLLQRTSFFGTYSYNLKINKKANISFGLGLGGVQHSVKIYDARPYDKDDFYTSNDVLNGFAFDANAGFYFYTKNFFLGFSNQHMPNGKILWKNSVGRLTSAFYSYTGYNFSLDGKKEWVIQPSIMVRTNSPAPYQLEFHLRTIYQEMIWVGLSYRQKSSTSFILGCNINKEYTVGYSYDLTLSAINNYSNGSHELIFSYLIPFKKKKSKSELVKDADEEELNKIDNTLKTNLRSKKKKETETETKTESKTEGGTETEKAKEEDPPKTSQPEKPKKKSKKGKSKKEETKQPESETQKAVEEQPKQETEPKKENE